MGFDGLWMDLEHHGTSLETAANLMRAARVGTSDVLCRPAKGEFLRLGRMLELGAQGIMYPRCDDAAEAREVVAWAKFAPQGKRGIDGTNADAPYGSLPLAQYIREANEQTFVAIQVEDQRGVANADEIAAVDGVDVLFLGPADFSILSGVPGQYDHPLVVGAIRAVAEAAKKAGKQWGMPVGSAEEAGRLIEMGARFLFHSSDVLMLKAGLESMKRLFGGHGFAFAG